MLPRFCSRLPALVAATIAAGFALASPAAAGFPPAAAWGVDPDPAVLEIGAELDAEPAAGKIAAPGQLAHAGQLSPKDNCHRHKAAGERHWHVGESTKRGGPCIRDDGETFHFGGNALCRDARLQLAKAERRYGADYRGIARALKVCIQTLPDGR